jgi:hypothetical protein
MKDQSTNDPSIGDINIADSSTASPSINKNNTACRGAVDTNTGDEKLSELEPEVQDKGEARENKVAKGEQAGTKGKGQGKRKRTRRKRKKQGIRRPGGNKRDKLKIMYENIEGKTRVAWSEVQNIASREQPDIVGLVETHWKEGQKGKRIKGYKSPFLKRRAFNQKKGGGIGVWVKDGVAAMEWEGIECQEEESKLEVEKERMWIIVKGKAEDMAVGVVYFACQQRQNEEWNDALTEKLITEMEMLRDRKSVV